MFGKENGSDGFSLDEFYDTTKKYEQQKSERNSLLNSLGSSLTPAEVLYSTVDDLKKKKQEKDRLSLKSPTAPNPTLKGVITGGASGLDNVKTDFNDTQIPLPSNSIENKTPNPQLQPNHNSSFTPSIEQKPLQEQKPKLLGKIPVENKKVNNSAEQGMVPVSNYQKKEENKEGTMDYYGFNETMDKNDIYQEDSYENTPMKAYLSYNAVNEVKNNENDTNQKDNQETLPSNDSISYEEMDEMDNENEPYLKDVNYNQVTKHIFVTEGGFVDKPNDRGGRTNKGVTQRTYDAYNKKHGLPIKDVKDITKEEANRIYYDEYWIASGANKIQDKDLAYMHYDAAINHGVGTAKRMLKESGGDFDKYYQIRKNKYDELAREPKQREFYNGWINRINGIKKIKQEGTLYNQ